MIAEPLDRGPHFGFNRCLRPRVPGNVSGDEQVRLFQVCEQRLANRIGIGADDGPDGGQ